MLTPNATMPETLEAQIPCADGVLLVALTDDLVTLVLSRGADHVDVQVDADALDVVRALLDDAARRMRAG